MEPRVPAPRPARRARGRTTRAARAAAPARPPRGAPLRGERLVPTARLVDQLWPDDPPSSAANLVQGYVSGLRRRSGRRRSRHACGYVARVEQDALDLQVFERLAHEGSVALENGQNEVAATCSAGRSPSGAALRSPTSATSPSSSPPPLASKSSRILALERRLAADIAIGRHADVVGEIETLRRRAPAARASVGPPMMALLPLGPAGRSARLRTAAPAPRSSRRSGSSRAPGCASSRRRCCGRIAPSRRRLAPNLRSEQLRSILVAALAVDAIEGLVELALPLARRPERELVVVTDRRLGRGAGAGRGGAAAPPHWRRRPTASRSAPPSSSR